MISSNVTSHMGFRLAYLYLTLAHFKGQDHVIIIIIIIIITNDKIRCDTIMQTLQEHFTKSSVARYDSTGC